MNRPEVDLSSCDREPIHIPGSIQPHGLLLVVDSGSGTVIHAAGDVETRLGVADWHGARLDEVLGGDVATAVLTPEAVLPRCVVPPRATEAFDLSVSRGPGSIWWNSSRPRRPSFCPRCCRCSRWRLRPSTRRATSRR